MKALRLKLVYIVLGTILALLIIFLCWQTTRQILIKKSDHSLALDEACSDADDQSSNVTNQKLDESPEEIFFVGCGGFF